MAAASSSSSSSSLAMFSQRGETCGPDSLFTILFEADGIRNLFAPYLTGSATVPAPENPYQQALTLAIQRYRKMKAASWETMESNNVRPFRTRSANEGEGAEVLRILSECDPTVDKGTKAGTLKKILQDFFDRDALGLPLSTVASVISIPGTEIPADKTPVAILLEFDQYVDAINVYTKRVWDGNNYSEEPTEEYEAKKDNRLNPERKHKTSGHVTALLRHDGTWYWADNLVGWLHEFKNQDFVTSYLLPALQTSSPLLSMGYLRDTSKEPGDLLFGIAANGVVYTGEPDLAVDSVGPDSVIDWSFRHFGLAEAHFFFHKKQGGGKRRRTRRHPKRRRLTRRRR
jgi:hypothetical protein